ncbi:MAG TPA: ABC transporter permease [Acidimicrobiales bacterium]|nr:ABC transporter permease [Acidimicrobiales bacterium]
MDYIALGLAIGMANALLAVGIVLTYMSTRVINLAHGELGAFCVAVMLALTRNAGWNYWAALAASLAATGLLAAVIEQAVIRRLEKSPRLIVLIATLGIAQLVIVGRLVVPKPRAGKDAAFITGSGVFPVPFDSPVVEFGRVVLRPQHFIALVVGPLLALVVVVLLRRSTYGIALRASAQNSSRALLAGIPVRRVSTIAWVAAGLLSGVASMLLAPVVGYSSSEAVGMPLLMRGLAGATIAGFDKLGVAFGAGLAIGVADQLIFLSTGRAGITDAIVFAVVLIVLYTRREQYKRTSASEETSWDEEAAARPLPLAILEHERWKASVRAGVVALGVAALATPFVLSESAMFFTATVFLVAVVAVSLTMLTGWAGQLSIGHWGLAGVGGVAGAHLVTVSHLPFPVAFAAAGVVGGLSALIIGLPALRLEGTSLAVITLGFGVAASTWLFSQPWFRSGQGLQRPSYLTNRWYYAVALVVLTATVGVTMRLQRGRIGRNMAAVRENVRQAESFGIDVVRTKLTGFVLSGVFAGLAGFLWALGVGAANGEVFTPVRSLTLVTAVVIGGLGSIAGAVIGAFYMLGIPYFGSNVSVYIGLLSTGIGVLTLVLFLPGGFARLGHMLRDRVAHAVTGLDPNPDVVPASLEDLAEKIR